MKTLEYKELYYNSNNNEITTKDKTLSCLSFEELLVSSKELSSKIDITKLVNEARVFEKKKKETTINDRYFKILELYQKELSKETLDQVKVDKLLGDLQALELKYGSLKRFRGIPVQESDFDWITIPLGISKKLTKLLQRFHIESEVRDTEDSIADLAKWLSLVTSTLKEMYILISDVDKAKIAPEKRAIIEYSLGKFDTTYTRGDVSLATEGTYSIDKILKRESDISKIISDIK